MLWYNNDDTLTEHTVVIYGTKPEQNVLPWVKINIMGLNY